MPACQASRHRQRRFFVTRTGTGADNTVSFTRAGSFRPDEEGYLRNAAGYYLQGWALDSSGNYVNTGNLSALTPVRVGELTGTATPTTRLQMRTNLQSTTADYSGAYTAGDMATGTVDPAFSRSLEVYDAQGGAHRLTLAFLKTAPNTWQAEIHADPASDVTATNGLLASGTIAFTPTAVSMSRGTGKRSIPVTGKLGTKSLGTISVILYSFPELIGGPQRRAITDRRFRSRIAEGDPFCPERDYHGFFR